MRIASLCFTFAFFISLFGWSQEAAPPAQPAAPTAAASDKLYINVGQAGVKKSQMAITPLKFVGTPSLAKMALKYEKELQSVIEKDLTVSSYFSIMSPAAFIESMDKGLRPAPVDANGFDFASWRQIGAEFLIKAGYTIIDDRITLDVYVYHVSQRELLLGRSYTAPLRDVRGLGHKFCNDLVEKLTGQKGFFLTKLVVSRSSGKNEKDIFVMDWDGENVRPITNFKTIAQSPSWSADGRYIAYTAFLFHTKRKSRNADLFIYDTKTFKHSVLSANKGINSSAAFFPDGQHAVIRLSPNNGTSDLYKMNLSTRETTPLTSGPRGSMNVEPAISPDGRQIAFSSDRSGRPMIYTMDASGGNPQRISFAGYYNSSPAWSPDGKKIAFASYVEGHFDIFVMDANGKNMLRLTSARKPNGKGADNEDPTFSPDGRFVMFRSNRTGAYQLYVATIDGKNEYRLTFDNHNYYRPQWSPLLP
jgi:TolB protein